MHQLSCTRSLTCLIKLLLLILLNSGLLEMGLGLLTFYFRSPKGSQKIFLGSGLLNVTDWLYWLISWLTNWLTDRLAQLLNEWLTDRLNDWLLSTVDNSYQIVSQSVTDWLTNWPTDWLTGGWLGDWLTDFSARQRTDKLTGWLVQLLNGWLCDW